MTTFLTVDQLADRVHRSPRTIQRWARERRIPSVKLGRSTLFTEDQVAEIAKAYTVEAVDVVLEHELRNPAYRELGPVVIPMRRPDNPAA